MSHDTRRQAEALHAFARLYGYVRYFHPSDAAADLDWERFAVLGARRVLDLKSHDDLPSTLLGLFQPIAPTIQVWREDEPSPQAIARAGPAPDDIVAWQHTGPGSGLRGSVYRSVRVGRGGRLPPPSAGISAGFHQEVPAAALRGRRVLLRAEVRAEVPSGGNSARMELTARNADGRWLASDIERHIVSSVATPYTCEFLVPDDAVTVTVGGRLSGGGCAWFRSFELSVVDGSDARAVDLTNTDFSQELEGWVVAARGSTVTAENGALRVEQDTEQVDRLFDALPDLGDVTEEPLAAGLVARVPLALSTDDASRTGSPAGLAGLRAALAETSTKNDVDPAVRAAAVVVTWNVFQHFYPYFDVVPLDWTERLSDAFENALEQPAEHELADVLTRVLVPLRDAHLHVIPPRSAGIRALPLRMRRLEDQVVVITSVHDEARVGDQVLAIDGVPIDVAFERELAKISGSPWWRQTTAALMLSFGPSLSAAKLDILRDGQRVTAYMPRERRDVPPRLAAEPIERLEDGVFVIDLDRAAMSAITDRIDEIAAAPGVVFDARGYPNSNHDVLKHLLDAPDEAGAWMNVAHVLRPDHRGVAGWTNFGWNMQPAEPRIRGKVAFLIGPDAASYAESCMSIVEHYRLGEIVGEPSAGTNGNMAFFGAPGDLTVTFTGMQVVKLDGSQHHLVGIQPTVPVSPTVTGVRAGRDEVLERALEIVRST